MTVELEWGLDIIDMYCLLFFSDCLVLFRSGDNDHSETMIIDHLPQLERPPLLRNPLNHNNRI